MTISRRLESVYYSLEQQVWEREVWCRGDNGWHRVSLLWTPCISMVSILTWGWLVSQGQGEGVLGGAQLVGHAQDVGAARVLLHHLVDDQLCGELALIGNIVLKNIFLKCLVNYLQANVLTKRREEHLPSNYLSLLYLPGESQLWISCSSSHLPPPPRSGRTWSRTPGLVWGELWSSSRSPESRQSWGCRMPGDDQLGPGGTEHQDQHWPCSD